MAAEHAAQAKGLTLELLRANNPESLSQAFQLYPASGAQGLVVSTDTVVLRMIDPIMAEIEKRRIPAISGYPGFALRGGLIGYGASIEAAARHAASFVDRIAKGAKPADLPVEQVSRYELVVNVKAASVLGLTIPHALLLRADRVIE